MEGREKTDRDRERSTRLLNTVTLNGRRGTYHIHAAKEEKRWYLTITSATESGHDRFVTRMINRERERDERMR